MTFRSAGNARDPHAEHDLERIAAFAAGDASASERALAESLLRECPACAALAADLRAIATATRRLPRTVPAPRDYRLTTATAARLRGGPWQRLLRRIGVVGLSPRPFAAAFTTLGIAGLLIAVVPFTSLLGSAGGVGGRDTAAQSAEASGAGGSNGGTKVVDTSGGTDGQALRPSLVPGGLPAPPNGADESGRPATSSGPDYGAMSPAPTRAPEIAPAPAPRTAAPASGASPIMILGLGFLVVGLALFAADRRSSRRR